MYEKIPKELKKVIRIANNKDKAHLEECRKKEQEAFDRLIIATALTHKYPLITEILSFYEQTLGVNSSDIGGTNGKHHFGTAEAGKTLLKLSVTHG